MLFPEEERQYPNAPLFIPRPALLAAGTVDRVGVRLLAGGFKFPGRGRCPIQRIGTGHCAVARRGASIPLYSRPFSEAKLGLRDRGRIALTQAVGIRRSFFEGFPASRGCSLNPFLRLRRFRRGRETQLKHWSGRTVCSKGLAGQVIAPVCVFKSTAVRNARLRFDKASSPMLLSPNELNITQSLAREQFCAAPSEKQVET